MGHFLSKGRFISEKYYESWSLKSKLLFKKKKASGNKYQISPLYRALDVSSLQAQHHLVSSKAPKPPMTKASWSLHQVVKGTKSSEISKDRMRKTNKKTKRKKEKMRVRTSQLSKGAHGLAAFSKYNKGYGNKKGTRKDDLGQGQSWRY